MKQIICIVLLVIFTQTMVFSQDGLSITVLRYQDGSALFECKIKKTKKILISSSYVNHEYWSEIGKYWITKQTNVILQSNLKKAIDWSEINKLQKKEFEKEINRIRVTPKDIFDFYKDYVHHLSSECKIIFKGYEDGTFQLVLSIDDPSNIYLEDITFTSKESISEFIEILNGRSVNKEIDAIFR